MTREELYNEIEHLKRVIGNYFYLQAFYEEMEVDPIPEPTLEELVEQMKPLVKEYVDKIKNGDYS